MAKASILTTSIRITFITCRKPKKKKSPRQWLLCTAQKVMCQGRITGELTTEGQFLEDDSAILKVRKVRPW